MAAHWDRMWRVGWDGGGLAVGFILAVCCVNAVLLVKQQKIAPRTFQINPLVLALYRTGTK